MAAPPQLEPEDGCKDSQLVDTSWDRSATARALKITLLCPLPHSARTAHACVATVPEFQCKAPQPRLP